MGTARQARHDSPRGEPAHCAFYRVSVSNTSGDGLKARGVRGKQPLSLLYAQHRCSSPSFAPPWTNNRNGKHFPRLVRGCACPSSSAWKQATREVSVGCVAALGLCLGWWLRCSWVLVDSGRRCWITRKSSRWCGMSRMWRTVWNAITANCACARPLRPWIWWRSGRWATSAMGFRWRTRRRWHRGVSAGPCWRRA